MYFIMKIIVELSEKYIILKSILGHTDTYQGAVIL